MTLTARLGIIWLLQDLIFTGDLFTVIPAPPASALFVPPRPSVGFGSAVLNFAALLRGDGGVRKKSFPGPFDAALRRG